ncbi:MAG: hypothetical protein CLLPBCKN_005526 [Chroococcidiopsis cubana SAG 39.79]|nr:hypothetical protein [Chroococcidiopsis cubana SAG 39.79]
MRFELLFAFFRSVLKSYAIAPQSAIYLGNSRVKNQSSQFRTNPVTSRNSILYLKYHFFAEQTKLRLF